MPTLTACLEKNYPELSDFISSLHDHGFGEEDLPLFLLGDDDEAARADQALKAAAADINAALEQEDIDDQEDFYAHIPTEAVKTFDRAVISGILSAFALGFRLGQKSSRRSAPDSVR